MSEQILKKGDNMADIKKIIGQNIRYERRQRNMSLGDLAKVLGITPAFLGLVERGQRGTDICKLVEVADVFRISLDSLILDRSKEGLKFAEPQYSRQAAVYSLISDMKTEELDFLISVIRTLKKMNTASK